MTTDTSVNESEYFHYILQKTKKKKKNELTLRIIFIRQSQCRRLQTHNREPLD